MTSIEWVKNADGSQGQTWNPIVGCSVLSPGCTNCYAMKMAARIIAMAGTSKTGLHYDKTIKDVKGKPVWTGHVAMAPDHILLEPLRRRKPTTYFVNSMGDLFHENIPDEWIDKVFAVMALCPQHTFQVLTKRAERMRDYCSGPQAPFRVARVMDAVAAHRGAGLEEVRPIAGYPGYFASSHGFIYSERRGKRRRMSPDIADQGHQRVQLHRDSKGNRRGDRLLVHRIILETFVGPAPSEDAQGRHRDGVPTNNAVSNLLWGGQSANWADAKRHGTHRRYSKLAEIQAAEIRRRHGAGGVSATQIRNIADGKQWAVESPIGWPLKNVWAGVSAERQQEADERIPLLLQTPAAVRFISAEPLIGAIDLKHLAAPRLIKGRSYDEYLDALLGERVSLDTGCMTKDDEPSLDWVIVGGESGRGARYFNIEWADDILAQCGTADVPCFIKQLGSAPMSDGYPLELKSAKGGDPTEWPERLRVREMPSLPSALAATSNNKSIDMQAHDGMPGR